MDQLRRIPERLKEYMDEDFRKVAKVIDEYCPKESYCYTEITETMGKLTMLQKKIQESIEGIHVIDGSDEVEQIIKDICFAVDLYGLLDTLLQRVCKEDFFLVEPNEYDVVEEEEEEEDAHDDDIDEEDAHDDDIDEEAAPPLMEEDDAHDDDIDEEAAPLLMDDAHDDDIDEEAAPLLMEEDDAHDDDIDEEAAPLLMEEDDAHDDDNEAPPPMEEVVPMPMEEGTDRKKLEDIQESASKLEFHHECVKEVYERFSLSD